jgi:TPR repeat protein
MKLLLLGLVLLWPVAVLAGLQASLEGHQRDGFTKTIREWRSLAEAGDASAQYNLGVIYDFGKGVPEDDAESAKWFRLAAEQGDAKAQFNLGLMYANGEGVPKDDAEAVKWYRLAAEQGDARAQVHLGLMYAQGKGVPEDYVQTYAWWNLAASQGNKKASKNMDIVRKNMTPAQIAEAQNLSRKLCTKIPNCAQ